MNRTNRWLTHKGHQYRCRYCNAICVRDVLLHSWIKLKKEKGVLYGGVCARCERNRAFVQEQGGIYDFDKK